MAQIRVMKFQRLRLLGFKSFCEPTDFLIEPGLTGVVGPNGCGKSNLVEALRWVMGESSYKNMRGSGMDDVIFSGGGSRPARNLAEVALVLDNTSRTAPAAFNDSETIEVTRRIEREQGSVYRVNGREVRARDVQLLFADAATGARSPALVRQGQIGEIIAAKPQQRRRILEDAAGVAGLHTRRHEAELRLTAASDNLTRLEDILKQVDSQAESLRRQARQAGRYRQIAAQIRQNEALAALIHYKAATEQLEGAERKAKEDAARVASRTLEQAQTAREQAIAAHELPALRDKEAEAGAALQRLISARDALDGDEKRARERIAELARHIEQFARDLERERALIDDAAGAAEGLEEERAELIGADALTQERAAEAQAKVEAIETALARTEAELAAAQDSLAGVNARKAALESALAEENRRYARFEAELTRLSTEFSIISGEGGGAVEVARLEEALALAVEATQEAEDAAAHSEAAHREARARESAAHQASEAAERKAQRLETETRTLEKLLLSGSGGLWPSVLEQVAVEKGYETALGAALGDDLEASSEPSAPAHWALTDAAADPKLPSSIKPLKALVTAPPAMARRLAQIGVVLRSEGESLRKLLAPGQRLVSKEGDLWRWDGFTQAAEAPTAAARRLVEKNRLADLLQEAGVARAAANEVMEAAQLAREEARDAASAESTAREAPARRDPGQMRRASASPPPNAATPRSRSGCPRWRRRRRRRSPIATRRSRSATPPWPRSTRWRSRPFSLERSRISARAATAERAKAGEARAAVAALTHESAVRAQRRAAILREIGSWTERRDKAQDRLGELEERLADAKMEQEELGVAPRNPRVAAARSDQGDRGGGGGPQGRRRRPRPRRNTPRAERSRRAGRARRDERGARGKSPQRSAAGGGAAARRRNRAKNRA